MKALKDKIVHLWNRLQVFFGYKSWARQVFCRPKFQICAFHGCRMKRGRKTVKGALYWCPKCKTVYHLEGGATKLVPVKEAK